MVLVDVVVSETGNVLCTRHSALPFGVAEAANAAAKQWEFEPYVVDGKAVKFGGELLFHFEDITDAQWRELARNAPPDRN
jgi:hypothetical protein